MGVGLTLVAAVLPAAQAWAGKLIIDAIVSATRQGMEPVAGLRYVAPYLALEFGLRADRLTDEPGAQPSSTASSSRS